MDFVTDLPESSASSYSGIAVIVNRLTQMAIYLPCRKDMDSPELAHILFVHQICKHGIPHNIIADRRPQYTSRFLDRACSHMSNDRQLSIAFHPQTNGQTEQQNQTIELYLRAFSNYEHDNWVALQPLGEFAYNNSMHASTRVTPFWAVYHRNPQMQFKAPNAPADLKSEIEADAVLQGLEETHRILRENLLHAQQRQTKYAGGKQVTFEVGYQVWLSRKHFRTTRPSKKLDSKRTGPYTVGKIITKIAYK